MSLSPVGGGPLLACDALLLRDGREVRPLAVPVAPAAVDLGNPRGSAVEEESIALPDFGALGRRTDELAARAFDSQHQDALARETGLGETFTNRDLAEALKRPRWLAEKMTYTLRRMGVVGLDGKEGRANLFRRSPD